ncbi:alpha/beta hydrolase family protein [Rhodococcoides kyotonense]|uniref:Alpha/beta hydrolase family protein n=1 Tax=Rhodococcoides kyotonense TaxID=398843 RepID=A0A239LQG8_9NOCA|nr:alpha/beta fold hydrolase [Rhodococcus kyotonensis]SNT32937.1 Alpha/beta hydrolase family protein [Rhodococcus kyotonensis]
MSNSAEPRLRSGPTPPAGTPVTCVVLVLHGGKVTSIERSRPWHLSGLRMWQFTRDLRRAGRAEGIVVAQLQYRFRGWNGVERSPVQDARWALREIRRDHPDVHVVVVGHSMGGRTAAAVADDPSVSGIVALAPWWPDGGELDGTHTDQVVRVVHGDADTWTDPVRARREVVAAAGRGVDAEFVSMPGGHFMLRRSRQWVRTTREFVMDIARRRSAYNDEVAG